jgi:hypothetical protein
MPAGADSEGERRGLWHRPRGAILRSRRSPSRAAAPPRRRHDAAMVSGAAEEVVARLVGATRTSAASCQPEQILEHGGRRSEFVNAGAAGLVT